ncbi:class I SAM-dependent methyltransferase [Gracilimonas sediminicola]|uniref:site-specific DNA-methyltransferase (adenine-specific) n=1 Tax=Gracilimonas sediminicola TaxID=2952158 RepID=A0A9X2RC26_9BACT|nr:class I SAM-dependent methyltransferase [Gracilimonas sediminicola]MCP9290576.1 class I SAM-dependent methyltransferase [Gracilimonas sediminicola]
MQLIKNASEEKLRGGFYTPEEIASFILKWAMNGSDNYSILEPSCGDGVFLKCLLKDSYQFENITAVEFNPSEAEKAAKIELPNKEVINEDFHVFCNETKDKYDLVIGNPPYIRYQYFAEEQQKQAEKIFTKAGLKYSKLTNAWVSFVVGSTLLLKDEGKIAFVVPAELLQVSYAQQLREFLAREYNKINIVSFEKLVFPDIQQEVLLLLCEKNKTDKHRIEHLEVKDASSLAKLDVKRLKSPKKKIDFENNKWTFYFLDQEEIDFLENVASSKKIPKIGDYAKVQVGITTGANSYFTVPLDTVQKYDLHDFAKPMVGRSVQVDSVIFNTVDWNKNREKDVRAHLLVFPPEKQLNGHDGAREYIKKGESDDVHTGYKTSIRDDWFVIPSVKLSDALFIRRNHLFPRLIANQAKAYTTDTMHRVFLDKKTKIKPFVASFYNSLSLAFSEISGRSHGGGVLELMPSETESVLLPYDESHEEFLDKIDSMMRSDASIDSILEFTDKKILHDGYGLSKKEIKLANSIWKKLSNRRLNRKH